jgi:hypothetical protein
MSTFIDMSAQSWGTTPLDGQQYLDVRPPQPGSIAADEIFAVLANNIGHL